MHAVDMPILQRDHAMGHVRDRGIMGNDRSCGPEFAIDPVDRLEHDYARLYIERSGRFVAQQDVGLLGDGPRNGHPLLLPPESCAGK